VDAWLHCSEVTLQCTKDVVNLKLVLINAASRTTHNVIIVDLGPAILI